MNFDWSDYENLEPSGYYIAPRSSPNPKGKVLSNPETLKDKPFFASNIEHYPHLPQPSGLAWVPKYLSYADLTDAVDKGFDAKQLCPADKSWPRIKSRGGTLFDWPTYAPQAQVQLGHNSNNAKPANWRLPNGKNMGAMGATCPNAAQEQFAGPADAAPSQSASYGYWTNMY